MSGDNIINKKFAYCNECEDLVEFDVCDEKVIEQYKGKEVEFEFSVGRCRNCRNEVATDIDYNYRKSDEKIRAYKRKRGILDLSEISEILEKYNVGKEALAGVAGFGKATIKRYYEGFIPAIEYSDILKKLLYDETYFMSQAKKNKEILNDRAYNKILDRMKTLENIRNSKIDQIANYIIVQMGEVTPLALEKLLSFSNGVNYALNGKQMIPEKSQAWIHGPVYPYIYNKYKSYGYKPIDNAIKSSKGCMLSLLKTEEIEAINLVIRTFGLYSPKTLEMISHTQTPWLEKRVDYAGNEFGNETIDEDSIKAFYVENKLNSDANITTYISNCIRGCIG